MISYARRISGDRRTDIRRSSTDKTEGDRARGMALHWKIKRESVDPRVDSRISYDHIRCTLGEGCN